MKQFGLKPSSAFSEGFCFVVSLLERSWKVGTYMECMKVYIVSEHLSAFDKWESNRQGKQRNNMKNEHITELFQSSA